MHDDVRFSSLLVVRCLLAFGRAPVIELHHLCIHFEPVPDLVLRGEDRPVPWKGKIGQMIIPNRIMQAEGLVTLAPAVTRPFVFFDDDRRHIELAQPSSKCDAALTATNDDAIGLTRVAEFSSFRLAFFLPRFSIAFGAVFSSHRTVEANWPFVPL